MRRSVFIVLVLTTALLAQDKPVDTPQSVAAKQAVEQHQSAVIEAQQAYIHSLIQADISELEDLDSAEKAAMQSYQLDDANRIKTEVDRADVVFSEHKKWLSQGLPSTTAPTTAPVAIVAPVATELVVAWTKTVEVSARDKWQETVGVKRGERYRITASGKWSHSVGYADSVVGPEGIDGRVCYLEARVGGGLPFGVGSLYEFIAVSDGPLEMEMMDSSRNDHSGSLQVKIELIGNVQSDMPAVAPIGVAQAAQSFQINAKDEWQSTIIVKAKHRYSITATGTWCGGIQRPDIYTCGPDGNPYGTTGDRMWYLEAKVNDIFTVGSSTTFTATQSGLLLLEMHDIDHSDNSGFVTAVIREVP